MEYAARRPTVVQPNKKNWMPSNVRITRGRYSSAPTSNNKPNKCVKQMNPTQTIENKVNMNAIPTAQKPWSLTQGTCFFLKFASFGIVILMAVIAIVVLQVEQGPGPTTSTTTATTTTATTATTTTATTTTTTSKTTTTTSSTSTSTSTTTSTTKTTSTTSSTSTTTTTTTTTTTAFDSCNALRWNQTGINVAGTGTNTGSNNGFKNPTWLYVSENGTLYVCDHDNNRIQMWINGATNGITVAGDSAGTSAYLKNPFAVTLDNNGFIYVSDHDNNRVQKFAPNSLNGTTVAGSGTCNPPTALDCVKTPTSIAVDNNSNIYIADTTNKRLVVWGPNATAGNILFNDTNLANAYGLVLLPNSSNQVYYSTQGGTNSIYWWTFNASAANLNFRQVDTTKTLNSPFGITLDFYGNLYVADKGANTVVMYCGNETGITSTMGTTVISDTTLQHPVSVGFDSDLNMYVLRGDNSYVVRYSRL